MAKKHKKKQKQPVARCIAVVHQKGGTGKTTTAINIAGCIAKSGYKVLVIDTDPQSCATSGLGIDKSSIQDSLYDVYISGCNDFPKVRMRDIILDTEIEGLHLAPASVELCGAEPYLYLKGADRSRVLHKAIADVRRLYDYIVIDTPPGTGQYLINSILAADHVIIALSPGIFALEGIEQIYTFLEDLREELQHDTDILGAVLTDCTMQSDIASDIQNEWERIFGQSVLGIIPHSEKICEAQKEGVPISHYEDSCDAARVYGNIADYIMDLGTQN